METLKELVARVLEVSQDQLSDDSSPENIDSWDSFHGLMMVSELEKNFSVTFTMEEVMAVQSYKDIKEALKGHGVKEGIE